MPLFKQVTAQQKRSKRKAEALLSDEEGNDSSSDEELLDSDSGESGSGSDESDSEIEGDEDEELLGPGEDDDEEPQVLDEDEPRPPPAGFPTAKAALENTVASTAALIAEMDAEKGEDGKTEEDDEEEAPLVCVVCPNKILKPGKMVEVHLASKDHKRRFNRFKIHVESPEFELDHLDADARWVASQLDKAVLARLSAQTQLGGKKAAAVAAASSSKTDEPTPSTSAAPIDESIPAASSPSKKDKSTKSASPLNPTKKQLAEEAEASGVSVREQMRQKWKAEKKERAKKRKTAKKEKFEERKRAKIEKGEKPEPFISGKPRFVEKIKPTAEEIETRQKWKAERNEAKAKGLPLPPKPVLAYELGGKVPVEKKASTNGAAPTKVDSGKKDKKAKVARGKKGDKQKKTPKAGDDEEGSKELLPEV
ncbi:hypothetical protein JCM16303_005411 [Sporobolomyces ruberrimus]